MTFVLIGLIAGIVGFVPALASPVGRKSPNKYKVWLVGLYAGIASWIFYANLTSLAYPMWSGVTGMIVVYWILTAMVVRIWGSDKEMGFGNYRFWGSDEEMGFGSYRRVITVPVVATILLGAGFGPLRSCTPFHAGEYAALAGEPEIREWNKDQQPKDPHHVRLVPEELAYFLADKQLGSAPGAIGSQFTLAKEYTTLQKVNDELVYVIPLDFKGFAAWTATKGAPGYIVVDGEDPNHAVRVVFDRHFTYTPGAYFNANLERHLWNAGYGTSVMRDFNLELDDAGKAWWVISILHPSIGAYGLKVDGVVTVDPENGAITFYETVNVPAWVDRVVPGPLVEDYLGWQGEFALGWWNSVWSHRDMMKPETPNIAYGSDGQAYWVTGISSATGNDRSMIKVAYTSTRTGATVEYHITGGTDAAVLDAVNQKVSFKHWHGADPVFYNVFGTTAAIVPLLGTGHAFQGVALVNVNTLQVVEGLDAHTAYREYQKILSGTDAVQPDAAHSKAMVEGTLVRFAADVKAGETTYFLQVEGRLDIFTGGSGLSAALPLSRAGDQVALGHVAAPGEKTVPLLSFENLSVVPPPTEAPVP